MNRISVTFDPRLKKVYGEVLDRKHGEMDSDYIGRIDMTIGDCSMKTEKTIQANRLDSFENGVPIFSEELDNVNMIYYGANW